MHFQKNDLWSLLVHTSPTEFLSPGKKTKLLLQLYLELEDMTENRAQNLIFRIFIMNNVSEDGKSFLWFFSDPMVKVEQISFPFVINTFNPHLF